MEVGILLSCFESNSTRYCMVQHMDPHMVASGQPCLNQFDCPLLTLTKVIRVLSPAAIVRAISVVHQCTSTCVVDSMHIAARMERQRVSENTLRLKHDWSNTVYCYNVYCIANNV